MRGVNWDVISDFRPGASRSRHPFEVFTLALALMSGLTVILGDTQSDALRKALPTWAEMVWGGLLIAGAGLALIGVWWPKRITGVIVEQVGLAMVGFVTVFYATCIVVYIGLPQRGVSLAYILGFGLSCIWRWFQLERLIQILHAIERGEIPAP